MATARRSRVDPRLVIGIVLVAGSIAGVVGVVQSTAQTTTVYALGQAVAAGETITAEQLTAVEVSAATPTELYLTDASADSYIATRPIGAGELVPLTALGEADTSSAAVVVSIPGELPGGVGTGTTVEIWSAAAGERMGTYDAPQVIVAEAQVIRVIEQDDFVATAQVDVELRIPDGEIATVMSATSNGARLQLVPIHEPVQE
ncbi:SAF domain-containing protein [Gulosibacter sp. ACHW.36C]|uniref:SAF domain-containing protein n=1 Tax=Gulosibacter sediminis TaxID=1729695 RepID=A0ABY4MXU8_9MICO|nr:SAF domain-containing protein [Gulosibacter sediminis]UQN15256.1 SAF domain-containing protein [Gulosibacter sediminis]